jgi:hypothetical protein
MDPKIAAAFGVLSMCCICSSIVSGAMSGGEEDPAAGEGAGAGPSDAGAADAGAADADAGATDADAGTADTDPSCDLSRGDDVYTGCGYVYQSLNNANTQCGSVSPTPFIWDDTEMTACGINREDTVYTGCGYIYQKERDFKAQCNSGGTAKFIPTE